MSFGLSENTLNKLKAIFEKYPEIEKVIIYGSRAKGSYKPASDIDITLIGQNISINTLAKLNWDIDYAYTPYFYDVSIFSELNSPELIDHINRVGKVFYEKLE